MTIFTSGFYVFVFQYDNRRKKLISWYLHGYDCYSFEEWNLNWLKRIEMQGCKVQFTPLIPQDIPRDRDTRVKYA